MPRDSPLIGKGPSFCVSSIHALLVDEQRKEEVMELDSRTAPQRQPALSKSAWTFNRRAGPQSSWCCLFSLLPSCRRARTPCRCIAPGSWRLPGWPCKRPGRWQRRRPRPGPWSYWSFLWGFQWGQSCWRQFPTAAKLTSRWWMLDHRELRRQRDEGVRLTVQHGDVFSPQREERGLWRGIYLHNWPQES